MSPASTGTVQQRLDVIHAWMEEEHPEAESLFRPDGCSSLAIQHIEAEMRRKLPGDYKQFLRAHDGQDHGAPMVETCSLFSLDLLPDEYTSLQKLFGANTPPEASAVGPGIKPVACAAGWIPIGRSARGRDYLCIDLEPGAGGVVGQIIQLSIDDDDRSVVAASFADLLSLLLRQMQDGTIDLYGDDE
jgi:molybdopterin molybdotransferase